MTTHQQLLYHVVFSTKNRKPYLQNKAFREDVFRYVVGTIEGLGAKSLIVGGYVDHVHLLVRIPAKECVSKIVGQTKSSTSLHINSNSNQIQKFGWQDGFGVFTLSPLEKDRIYHYIATQEEHPSGRSVEEEYRSLLEENEVMYDEKYLFD
ncbi:MAG: IS200/IS605 family transposase [Planctomycetota bacterium]